MNQIVILGKRFFVSKSGKDCYILNYGYKDEQTEGMAISSQFVSAEVFNKALVSKNFEIVYSADYSGRAVIRDLLPVG